MEPTGVPEKTSKALMEMDETAASQALRVPEGVSLSRICRYALETGFPCILAPEELQVLTESADLWARTVLLDHCPLSMDGHRRSDIQTSLPAISWLKQEIWESRVDVVTADRMSRIL